MSKSYAKARQQLQHRLDDLNSMATYGRPTFHMFLTGPRCYPHFWYTVASEQNRWHRFFDEKLFIEKETAKGGLKYFVAISSSKRKQGPSLQPPSDLFVGLLSTQSNCIG